MTYRALHLTRPHIVELVVRQLGSSLRQLRDVINHSVDGLFCRLEDLRNCISGEQLLVALLAGDSRLDTGVECALDSTKETLRSVVRQRVSSSDSQCRTVLFERLDDVFELLSRCECVFTCSWRGDLSHREQLCPRRRAPGGPGRWPGRPCPIATA